MPAKLIITPEQHETIHNILNRMLVGINDIPNILFLDNGNEELGISEEEGEFLREAMQLEGLVTNADGPKQNGISQLTAVGVSIARSPGGYRAYLQRQKQEQLPLVREDVTPIALVTLHPTVQQAAGSRFASAHYSDAILAACTALDKAVQVLAGLPPSTVGTSLMTTAFSAKAPLIRLAQDTNEQTGFMNLYQGTVQAIRNHYAHNLTPIPAPRALEWLGFISALFYKLEEAHSSPSTTS